MRQSKNTIAVIEKNRQVDMVGQKVTQMLAEKLQTINESCEEHDLSVSEEWEYYTEKDSGELHNSQNDSGRFDQNMFVTSEQENTQENENDDSDLHHSPPFFMRRSQPKKQLSAFVLDDVVV